MATALLINRNMEELHLPQGQRLDVARQVPVGAARRRLGPMLTLGTWSGHSQSLACSGAIWRGLPMFACDPPYGWRRPCASAALMATSTSSAPPGSITEPRSTAGVCHDRRTPRSPCRARSSAELSREAGRSCASWVPVGTHALGPPPAPHGRRHSPADDAASQRINRRAPPTPTWPSTRH
jgi:hypothetical protein